MKIITLEEHFCLPEIREAWQRVHPELLMMQNDRIERALDDLGPHRIEQMDTVGVDVQVLSLTTPGTHTLPPAEAVTLARRSNHALAKAIAAFPDRLGGFATVPTPAPPDAVSELKRCVEELGFHGLMLDGRTGDRHIDHPDFFPLFETAARLKIPVYIHPQVPPAAVRQAYYGGFEPRLNTMLGGPGFGWHVETGIQALRLVLRGTFDRLPDLQIILGHWGETVFPFLERINMLTATTKDMLARPVIDYFKNNFYLTPSGLFFPRMLREAIDLVGIDRLLFSIDYPYIQQQPGAPRKFLAGSGLSASAQAKIASQNWERLTGQAS